MEESVNVGLFYRSGLRKFVANYRGKMAGEVSMGGVMVDKFLSRNCMCLMRIF